MLSAHLAFILKFLIITCAIALESSLHLTGLNSDLSQPVNEREQLLIRRKVQTKYSWNSEVTLQPNNKSFPNSTHSLLPIESLGRVPCAGECRRIALIKTHKTGSSTLANIIYRFGENRSLRFMLPRDDLRLGWPGSFPGEVAMRHHVKSKAIPGFGSHPKGGAEENAGSYDVIAFHAVFNPATMLRFVPNARFVTIVRYPGEFGAFV